MKREDISRSGNAGKKGTKNETKNEKGFLSKVLQTAQHYVFAQPCTRFQFELRLPRGCQHSTVEWSRTSRVSSQRMFRWTLKYARQRRSCRSAFNPLSPDVLISPRNVMNPLAGAPSIDEFAMLRCRSRGKVRFGSPVSWRSAYDWHAAERGVGHGGLRPCTSLWLDLARVRETVLKMISASGALLSVVVVVVVRGECVSEMCVELCNMYKS